MRKVKPLHRLAERETAAYAFLRGIDYIVEECPLVAGNTQLRYKDAMNRLEADSPGTKASFYLGYLDRASDRFRDAARGDDLTRLRAVRPADHRPVLRLLPGPGAGPRRAAVAAGTGDDATAGAGGRELLGRGHAGRAVRVA